MIFHACPVGTAHIAHEPLRNEIVERAHGFLHRRDGVLRVNLVEVDVVGAEAFEAALYGIHDVPARGADVVRAFADAAVALRGDHHVGALHADILQRLAEQRFRTALGIDVRGVDEIDAGFQRARNNARRTPSGRACRRPARSPGRRTSWCRGRFRKRTGRCFQVDCSASQHLRISGRQDRNLRPQTFPACLLFRDSDRREIRREIGADDHARNVVEPERRINFVAFAARANTHLCIVHKE